MRSAADLASELDEGLKLLFQAGLELSLAVQANAMAAEPEEQARLGLTFHRLSRGVRQTAALRMRLAREAERSGREATAEVIQLDKARAETRRAQVQATVERLIWTETESQEREDHLCDVLAGFLDEDDAYGRLAEGDVAGHVARICGELGLPSPLAGEGGSRRGSEEGLHGDAESSSSAEPDSLAQPLIRPADAGHLLPQGEKDDDPLLSDDDWRSSA